MTAYTTIPGSSIDADSVIDVALMTALRDNPIAIAEGDATAPVISKVGPSCTGGTQSVGDNSTKLATTAFCEAGFVNNDVGALGIGMIIMGHYSTPTTVASGATVSGANLLYMSGSYTIGSGTWRNISGVTLGGTYDPLPFQRIS